MDKQVLFDTIQAQAPMLCALSDKIWAYSELSMLEYKSAGEYIRLLREQGFTVQERLCGLPTAFCGSFGSGKPVIGILGEFDALSGLSQQAGATQRTPREDCACGQGCGHNLLGAAAFGFSLSFSVCCFAAAFGGAGVLLALAVFGIRSLVSVPGFFLLAVPALRSAALRSSLPFGRGKRVASAESKTGRWKRLFAVSAALLAALLLESALSPGLLRLVWEHFIAA